MASNPEEKPQKALIEELIEIDNHIKDHDISEFCRNVENELKNIQCKSNEHHINKIRFSFSIIKDLVEKNIYKSRSFSEFRIEDPEMYSMLLLEIQGGNMLRETMNNCSSCKYK